MRIRSLVRQIFLIFLLILLNPKISFALDIGIRSGSLCCIMDWSQFPEPWQWLLYPKLMADAVSDCAVATESILWKSKWEGLVLQVCEHASVQKAIYLCMCVSFGFGVWTEAPLRPFRWCPL